jgi:C-terminal processing protease CtpA/Prc
MLIEGSRATSNHKYTLVLMALLIMLAWACSSAASAPTPDPLPPDAYLESVFQWLQSYAILGADLDWDAVRREAQALTPDPKTTADTYPAICLALEKLNDGNAWLGTDRPKGYTGIETLDPENKLIINVDPGSAAEDAGIQVGDVIEEENGAPPEPSRGSLLGAPCLTEDRESLQLKLRRPGQDQLIEVTIEKTAYPEEEPSEPVGRALGTASHPIGYVELALESGARVAYATLVQRRIKTLDQNNACGWIIDVRRNPGGDIWSYLAAIGPILGEGDVGGFVYHDGRRETWSYRSDGVYWDGNLRSESEIDGPVYQLKRAMPPVALLTSPETQAAAELAVVAFRGRPDVRTFGEATRGQPMLITHTELSDGANLFVSGAFSFDRDGNLYDGSLAPDVSVQTDWTQFAADQDPVVQAALTWLQSQPACTP